MRIEHLEVEALLLERILARDAEPPRLERADAGRDDDGAGGIVAPVGLEHEVAALAILDPAEPGDDLAQMRGRAELEPLDRHVPHQVLGQHLGEAGDVEDVLLRVQGHELAPERGQGVDDAGRRPPHPGVEGREEPGGPPADDRNVLQLLLGHVGSCVCGRRFGNKRWNV